MDIFLASTGMPPHPGPVVNDSTLDVVLSSQNITSISNYFDPLISYGFDVGFLQETSIPKQNFSSVHALMATHHAKGFLTGADPEFSSPVGGVAAIAETHIKI
eukprot:631646-Karenia_brevis.AAC.1